MTCRRNGTVHVIQDLNNANPITKEIQSVLLPAPGFLAVSMEPVGRDTCAIVDYATGRIVEVDIEQGSHRESEIGDSTIQIASQRNKNSIEAASKAGIAAGRPAPLIISPAIMATANDNAGNLYCLPAPINPSRPLFLKFGADGLVRQRFRTGPARKTRFRFISRASRPT